MSDNFPAVPPTPPVMARPGVGVGVFIRRSKTVLLGQRKGSHGAGTWSLPGGHLEMYETPLDTALREVAEETGVRIGNVHLAGIYTNDPMPQWKRHYVTLYVVSDWVSGEPRILEPDKCVEWRWCRWTALPSPLFTPLENLIKQRYSPFDRHCTPR